MRGDAGDINNAAAAALAHGGAKLPGRQERSADEVEVEIGAPVRGIDFLKRILGSNGRGSGIAARGADEDGEFAKPCPDGLVGAGAA